MDPNKYLGIDIFSGAGGLSVGAEWAGITVSVAIESERNFADTYQINHPATLVVQKKIEEINPESLFDESPFVLFGGPPCQGFSTSNTRTRNQGNPNNRLFEEFIRYVDILTPQWLVFENVDGIGRYQKGEVIRQLKLRLEDLGYRTWNTVLRASEYGVPQTRNRFFLVGNRVGLPYMFPTSQARCVTVREAIEDLPVLQNGSWFDSNFRTGLNHILPLPGGCVMSRKLPGKIMCHEIRIMLLNATSTLVLVRTGRRFQQN